MRTFAWLGIALCCLTAAGQDASKAQEPAGKAEPPKAAESARKSEPSKAPEAPPSAEPTKEHKWLEQLAGQWTYESEMLMGPDVPPEKCTGSETVRTLGGLWFICEGSGKMPNEETMRYQMTLGYDPDKKKFVGTWIASVMTHMWVYQGTLDSAGKVLTLETEGPSFFDESAKTAKYRDVIEIISKDERKMTSSVQGADGKWTPFMNIRYRRAAR